MLNVVILEDYLDTASLTPGSVLMQFKDYPQIFASFVHQVTVPLNLGCNWVSTELGAWHYK